MEAEARRPGNHFPKPGPVVARAAGSSWLSPPAFGRRGLVPQGLGAMGPMAALPGEEALRGGGLVVIVGAVK